MQRGVRIDLCGIRKSQESAQGQHSQRDTRCPLNVDSRHSIASDELPQRAESAPCQNGHRRPVSTFSGPTRIPWWTSQLGGKCAFRGRPGKDRSPHRSRRSIARAKQASPPGGDVRPAGPRARMGLNWEPMIETRNLAAIMAIDSQRPNPSAEPRTNGCRPQIKPNH